MKYIKSFLIGFIVILSSGASVSYADCIEDAGDVFLAVFTGGASYAICQMVETIELLLHTVRATIRTMSNIANDTVNAAVRTVNESANSVMNTANTVMRQFSALTRSLQSTKSNAIRSAEARAEKQRQEMLRANVSATNTEIVKVDTLSDSQRSSISNLPSKNTNSGKVPTKLGSKSKINQAKINQAKRSIVNKNTKTSRSNNFASVQEIEQAMNDAIDKVSTLETNAAANPFRHIESSVNLAKNTAERQMSNALRIAETTALAPLRELENIFTDFLSNPANIADPTSVVRAHIQRVTESMLNATEEMHSMIINEPLAMINDTNAELGRLTADFEEAERIHQAMREVERKGDKASVLALNRLVHGIRVRGSSTTTATVIAARTTDSSTESSSANKKHGMKISSSKLSPGAKASFQLHPQLDKLIKELNTGSNKLATINLDKVPSSIEQRAKVELDRITKNKSPAEVSAIKQQYKQQALNFANKYPNMKVKVNQNFDQKFDLLLNNNQRPRGIENDALQPRLNRSIIEN